MIATTNEGAKYKFITSAETVNTIVKQFGLPDFVKEFDKGNLDKLKKAVVNFESDFKKLLQNHEVKFKEYSSIDELKHDL